MSKNSRFNYLAKNTILFTISSFGSKLLSFLLVPLYTNILTTSDYGIADLITTTVSFLIPILTINIAAAVMRYSIDNPESSGKYFKYGSLVILYASVFLAFALFVVYSLDILKWKPYYYLFLFLIFVFDSLEGLFTQYFRGVDKVQTMVIASLISTFVRLGLNVITLAFLHWGIIGYLISMVAGPILSIFYSSIIVHPISIIKNNKLEKKAAIYKEMNAYAFVLGLNAIGWTVATSLDKYILTWLKGVSDTGVYSVSYKIPSIITMICTLFTQAWSLSAIREYKSDDHEDFYNKMYEFYHSGLVISCSILLLFNIPLSKLLFAKDFFEAWKYTPSLVFAMVFNGMSSFLAPVFSAVKKNKVMAVSTLSSAVVNTILNFCLIPLVGTIGAAISTAISFFVVFAIRLHGAKKYIKFNIHYIRDCIVYGAIILQIVLASYANRFILFQISITITLMIINFKSIKKMLLGIKYIISLKFGKRTIN